VSTNPVFPAGIHGTSVVVVAVAVLHTTDALLEIGVLAPIIGIAGVYGARVAIGAVDNLVLAEALFVGWLNATIEGADTAIVTRRIVTARLAETVSALSVGAKSSATVACITGAEVTVGTLDILGDAEALQ
jgi:hypothetical protein